MDIRWDECFDVIFDVFDDVKGGGDYEEDERDNGEYCGYFVSIWKV